MAALVTPAELIIFLDLPDDTQPTDRATAIVDLVLGEVAALAPGGVLTEPYPARAKSIAILAAARLYDNPTGLRTRTVGANADTAAVVADDAGVLTAAEKAALVRVLSATTSTAPLYTFPDAQAWPDVAYLLPLTD